MQHYPSLQTKWWTCSIGCFPKLRIASICIQVLALYCVEKLNPPINSCPLGGNCSEPLALTLPSSLSFPPCFFPYLFCPPSFHIFLSCFLFPTLPYPAPPFPPSLPSLLPSLLHYFCCSSISKSPSTLLPRSALVHKLGA